MPSHTALHAAWMLTAAAALSARGKLLDASRTQRLRKTTDRSSVLGMAAAALALATAEDDGEDDARAQIAELAAAAAQNVAVDATLVGRRITDAAFYFHRAGASNEELFRRLERRFVEETWTDGVYVSGDDIYPDDSRDARLDHGADDGCGPARIVLNAYERLAAAGCVCEETTAAAATAAGRLLPENAPPRLVSYIDRLGCDDARPQLWLWRAGSASTIKLHAVDANGSLHAGHENRGRQRRRDFREGTAPAMPPAPPLLSDLFADDTRPLRLDLGCGLGAAARGWASDETRNVLGVDASRSLVKACAARAKRDKCGANLAYVATDALSILAAATAYAGPLEAISVQHPTPPNTRGALDWILAPDVVDAARDALAPGGVLAVETRSARAAAAAREGLVKAGFALVPGAWPLPEAARSETGGACVALGWEVERLVFRVPLDDGAPVPAAVTRRRSCSTAMAALAWVPRCAFAFDVSVGAATGDVLYPASLVGEWRCERVLTAVEGDQTAAEGAWRALGGGTTPFVAGRAETYETRFVAPAAAATYEFEGRDVAGVVLDRAFELEKRRGSGGAVSWDPRAPSILRDGDATLTVVSRTSEISEAGFGFDELVRVDAAAGGLIGGAARVSRLVRVKRRFRRAFAKDGRRVVEGLEIVKTYRVLDGVAEADLPTSSAKSTLRFERPLA